MTNDYIVPPSTTAPVLEETNHFVFVDPKDMPQLDSPWVDIGTTDIAEEEENKWQLRAHLGEIEEEVKTLRDAVIIFGIVTLAVSMTTLGVLLYAFTR